MTGTDSAAPTLTSHFADAFPELAVPWQAQTTPAPRLLHLNVPLAEELGLDPEHLAGDDGVRLLTGETPFPGARPVAQGYAGHQFGQYSPVLGDGRALLLGELTDRAGRLQDLHLKGSGPTPFSRPGADGQAVVGPMLRELVVGEAMHALGVPTTRALAVVGTGRTVRRGRGLPGAVLARVADSHLRVGTFQYAAALVHAGRAPEDLVPRLVEDALTRHHRHRREDPVPARALLEEVVAAQAALVARWMLVGFVHGVMNTDNMTISGQTIDYGPCAFLDAFDPQAVFSSIDRQGRYAYGNQPPVTLWDLNRFAETLLPHLDPVPEDAVAAAEAALEGFAPAFDAAWQEGLAAKLGVARSEAGDDVAARLLGLLTEARADWTAFWADLADVVPGPSPTPGTLPGLPDSEAVRAWRTDWLALAPDPERMRTANPRHVPRNRPLQDALDAADDGDLAPVERILAAVRDPFTSRPDAADLAFPSHGDEGGFVTFCGT